MRNLSAWLPENMMTEKKSKERKIVKEFFLENYNSINFGYMSKNVMPKPKIYVWICAKNGFLGICQKNLEKTHGMTQIVGLVSKFLCECPIFADAVALIKRKGMSFCKWFEPFVL